MTKKIIEVIVCSDIKYELRGPLKDALEEITRLIEEHGEDARLEIDAEYESYSYDNTRYAYARVFAKREETDEEYLKRTATEAKDLAKQEARDRQAYERLKKQFEQ